MYYLAIWERLRGENLNINLDSEQSVASAATAIMIIVMPNIEKLSIFYRYNVCQIQQKSLIMIQQDWSASEWI